MEKFTEDYLRENIREVQQHCLKGSTYHRSQVFVGSPDGHLGIVVEYVVCADEIAQELKKKLDAVVQEVLAEHGLEQQGGENVTPIR